MQSNITSNSAIVNGAVNPNNLVTAVSFQYGTTMAYGSQIGAEQSPINGGIGSVNVTATITGLLSNTLYHFRVQAVGGGTTINGSDASFTTAFEYPASININQTFTFNDLSKNSYRMIGLPGDLNMKVSDLMTGTQKKEWNAFFDNGAVQDYMIEFDNGSNFFFSPGKGFWILSKTQLSMNKSVNTVSLSADNTYSIPLHSGWNIISNPLDKNVNWSDIQNINTMNTNDVIYSWSGTSFNQSTNFETFKGYYFNNMVSTRITLKIPYDFIGKIAKEFLPKKTNGMSIRLSLFSDKQEISYAIAGIDPSSQIDFDNLDYFAPPGDFADIRIQIEDNNLSIPYKELSIDYRPEINEGQIFDLKIKNETKKDIKLVAGELDNFIDYEIYLIDENLNRFYNLKEKNAIDISPIHFNYKYKLLIGNETFINKIKKDYIPTEYGLYQNYPNPFNPSTILRYQIPVNNTFVELKIYDMLGKVVKTLINEIQNSGIFEIEFNASNFSSGVYFYTLKAMPNSIHSDSFSSTRKMLLIK